MLKAIVFDFDGVIVDTEKMHHEAFLRAAPEGIKVPTWEEYQVDYIGYDDRDAFRAMYSLSGLTLDDAQLPLLIEKKAAVFVDLVEKDGPEPFPGVVELISLVHQRHHVALSTGSLYSDIEPILKPLGLLDKFDVVVTADDVAASKPDPESYVRAVQKLAERFPDEEIEPGHCAAIEDTPYGLMAASGAGLFTIGVSNTHAPDALHRADQVVASLAPAASLLDQVDHWLK